MILVDTSAWIEFLRATGSAEHVEVRTLIERDVALCTTEPIIMELLAGARDDRHLARLRRFLLHFEHLPIEGMADYEVAASLFRRCRRAGGTPRSLVDCLVAAVALREDVPVLARDRDFVLLERVAGLRVHAPA